MALKTYPKLILRFSFAERLDYLFIGDNNNSSPRDISNKFYKSKEWLTLREDIIVRDFGCDLAVPSIYIQGPIIVHHINPINKNDIIYRTKKLLDPDNLICTSLATHNKIHYTKDYESLTSFVERTPNDTTLW